MTVNAIANIIDSLAGAAVRLGRAARPHKFGLFFAHRFAEDTLTPLRASAGKGETVLNNPTQNIALPFAVPQ